MTDKAKPKVPSSERNPDVAEPAKHLESDRQAPRELMDEGAARANHQLPAPAGTLLGPCSAGTAVLGNQTPLYLPRQGNIGR